MAQDLYISWSSLDSVDGECNGDTDLRYIVNSYLNDNFNLFDQADDLTKSLTPQRMGTVDPSQLALGLIGQEQLTMNGDFADLPFLNSFDETTPTTGGYTNVTAATTRPANVISNEEQFDAEWSQYLPQDDEVIGQDGDVGQYLMLPATVEGNTVDDVLKSPSSLEEPLNFSTIEYPDIFASGTATVAPPSVIQLSATPATSLPGNRCLPEPPLNVGYRLAKPLSVDTASLKFSAATTTVPLAVANSSLSPDQIVPAEPALCRTSPAPINPSSRLPHYSFYNTGIGYSITSTQSGLVLSKTPAVAKLSRLSADTAFQFATSSVSGVPIMVENDEEITTSVTTPTKTGVKRGRPPSSVSTEADGSPLSDKKERRKKQNREAATRCRDKRKKEHETLKEDHQKLQKENADLKRQLEKVEGDYKVLQYRMRQHSQACPGFRDPHTH